MSTNYRDTFITAAPDSTRAQGQIPAKAGSVAALQFALLSEAPYRYTSDDLLFEVHAQRQGIAGKEREQARAAFFAKPQACLRASPLVKQYGWGIHHDSAGRIALYGVETPRYRQLAADPTVAVVAGMRSRRT